MNYNFGKLNNGDDVICIINGDDIIGQQRIETKYADANITDTFEVIEKIKEVTENGINYKWFTIKNHTQVIDKSVKDIKTLENAVIELAEIIGG